jgi:membrane protein DedA with SNARE-associated domain
MESFIHFLSQLNPLWIYVAIASIAFIENIFPPFPSDVIVVAAGSMAGLGRVDFFTALVLATAGSTAGFLTMYKIGDWFGVKILEQGKIKFIPIDKVHLVEGWFKKHGYLIVVVNRFLAGTRAVVSFFAGLSELSLWKSLVLSATSALAWNFLLLYLGRELGENWRSISSYLESYGIGMSIALGLALVFYFAYKRFRKKTAADSAS